MQGICMIRGQNGVAGVGCGRCGRTARSTAWAKQHMRRPPVAQAAGLTETAQGPGRWPLETGPTGSLRLPQGRCTQSEAKEAALFGPLPHRSARHILRRRHGKGEGLEPLAGHGGSNALMLGGPSPGARSARHAPARSTLTDQRSGAGTPWWACCLRTGSLLECAPVSCGLHAADAQRRVSSGLLRWA